MLEGAMTTKPTKQHQIRISEDANTRLEHIAETTGHSVAFWASELLMAATDALAGNNRFDSMAAWIKRNQEAWSTAIADEARAELAREALRAARNP